MRKYKCFDVRMHLLENVHKALAENILTSNIIARYVNLTVRILAMLSKLSN